MLTQLGNTGSCDPASAASESSRVSQWAARQLRETGYPALTTVSCHYHEGVLILRGCVPSYHLKQVAQTVVAQLPEVQQVVNRLTVR